MGHNEADHPGECKDLCIAVTERAIMLLNAASGVREPKNEIDPLLKGHNRLLEKLKGL